MLSKSFDEKAMHLLPVIVQLLIVLALCRCCNGMFKSTADKYKSGYNSDHLKKAVSESNNNIQSSDIAANGLGVGVNTSKSANNSKSKTSPKLHNFMQVQSSSDFGSGSSHANSSPQWTGIAQPLEKPVSDSLELGSLNRPTLRNFFPGSPK